jgi:hypothetical protein
MPHDPVRATSYDGMVLLDGNVHGEKIPEGEDRPGSQRKPQCHANNGRDCRAIPFHAFRVPQVSAFKDSGELSDVNRPYDLGACSPIALLCRNGEGVVIGLKDRRSDAEYPENYYWWRAKDIEIAERGQERDER